MLDKESQNGMRPTLELESEIGQLLLLSLRNLTQGLADLQEELRKFREEKLQQRGERSPGAGTAPAPEVRTLPAEVVEAEMLPTEGERDCQPPGVPAIAVVAEVLQDPDRVADADTREKLSGLTRFLEGVRQLGLSVSSRLSQGVARFTGGERTLADDINRQHAVSLLVDRMLELSGHQRPDGSRVARGTLYHFERDASGGMSINDISGAGRGTLFSLKEGELTDRLTRRDIDHFNQAAKTIDTISRRPAPER
jgi:hypothetical protein